MSLQDAKLAMKYLLNWRGKREEHARRLFFRAAKRFTPYVASDIGANLLFVSTSDRVIGQDVFLEGAFDESAMRTAFEILASLGYPDLSSKLFVDVGANIGTNCIAIVRSGRCAGGIALEPDPRAFQLLKVNLAANELLDRVRAHNLALSDSERDLELALDSVTPGN